MKKKIIGILVVTLLIATAVLPVLGISNKKEGNYISHMSDEEFNSDCPDDFEMLIYCGGFNTWDPIYILHTNMNGESQYYILTSENRSTGDLNLVSSFNFTENEMNVIWDTIVINDYFNLNNYYAKENVYGGTFANITITANSLTKSIQAENIEIDEFDNVVKKINSLTPDDNDLHYNALFNHVPFKPDKPIGEVKGDIKKEYSYTTDGYDIDDDDLYFMFDWGDNTTSDWQGPYESNENVTLIHSWNQKGEYNVRVKIIDDPNNDGDLSDGNETVWSDPLIVSMPKNKQISNLLTFRLLKKIIEKCHILKSLFLFLDAPDFVHQFSGLNDDGYDPNSGTRAKYENCEITIEWYITLYGEWVDCNCLNATLMDKVCDKIEDDMEERWNRDKWDKDDQGGADGEPPWRVPCKEDCTEHEPGCIVRFNADVSYWPFPDDDDIPKGGEAETPEGEGSHWMHLNGPEKPKGAYVNAWGPDKKLPKPNNGMETTGEFNVDDVEGVWAHEGGHLLGLVDEYGTVSFGLPFGGVFSVNIPLSDSIMAHPDNYPTQEDIDEAVKNSGIECPCECCPEENDTEKPKLHVSSPQDGASVSSPMSVTGYATDYGGSGVAELDYKFDWNGGTYDGGSTFIDPPDDYVEYGLGPINLGNYIEPGDWIKITIYAIDAADNTGEDSVTVTWVEEEEDTIPPVTEKTIGEPQWEDGYTVASYTPIWFEATDPEPGSGVDYIHYEVWQGGILMGSEDIPGDAVEMTFGMYGVIYGIAELRWYAVDNVENAEDMHYQEHFILY